MTGANLIVSYHSLSCIYFEVHGTKSRVPARVEAGPGPDRDRELPN